MSILTPHKDTVPGLALSASIVIPTLNEEAYVPKLLESLKAITAPLDIVVVDGDSQDDTAGVVEKYRTAFGGNASLRFVRSPQRNISFQRNLGASVARYPILIFSDADIVIPSPDAHVRLLQIFAARGYVVAAPRLVPLEAGFQFFLSYLLAYYVQRFLLLFKRPYFAGSYLITTKETFEKVGGFDPAVLLGEDVDYSLRAAEVGTAGLINIPYPVSVRRLIKYGYGWLLKEIPNLLRFLWSGRVVPDTIFYPFGEFGGQPPHHVTKNRGKI